MAGEALRASWHSATSLPAMSLVRAETLGDEPATVRVETSNKTHTQCGLVLAEEELGDETGVAMPGAFAETEMAVGDNGCNEEIRDAIKAGARTLDGIKFRTRCQSGRCHGGFCTTRAMKILAEETGRSITEITKRGKGTEIVKGRYRDVRMP